MSVFVLRFFHLILISSLEWLGRKLEPMFDIINIRKTDNTFSYMWGENRVLTLFPVPWERKRTGFL